ncbi:hypothetical protein [Corynebacterium hindlerae]|uniref:hypothetical protein n=1 Tax=Corynebacterium hindlerae TaxID=699041 RepID=UPI003AAB3B07
MTDMQSSEWQKELVSRIGRAIDRAREGKSDQWIADRTRAMGNPLSRTAVSEYRRGIRKTITVADWLTLAAALGVPPVSLLFPDLPDGPVDLLPAAPATNSFDALLWVIGERQTIPEGFDVLFALDTGEMMGEVTGIREYRKTLGPASGPLDLRDEEDPSKELCLLDKLHELRKLFVELSAIESPFKIFEIIGSESERQQIMDSYIKRLTEKQEQIKKIDELIESWGAIVQEETVTQYGEPDGDS